MIVDLDVKDLFDGLLDILDPGVAEFDHLAGIGQDDVVVLFVKVRFFVMSN